MNLSQRIIIFLFILGLAISVPRLTFGQTTSQRPSSDISSSTCTNPLLPDSIGTVTTSFTVDVEDTYKIWALMKPANTKNNSFYLQIDDTCPILIGDSQTLVPQKWSWVDFRDGNTESDITLQLTKGTHILKVAGNELGVGLDKFLILRDITCLPSGLGENCTSSDSMSISPTQGDISEGPSITITSPTTTENLKKNTTTTIQAAVTSIETIQKVEFYINGRLECSETIAPYSCLWNIPATAIPTNYVLSVKAYDTKNHVGNTSLTVSTK